MVIAMLLYQSVILKVIAMLLYKIVVIMVIAMLLADNNKHLHNIRSDS